jgi:hypothetical protein
MQATHFFVLEVIILSVSHFLRKLYRAFIKFIFLLFHDFLRIYREFTSLRFGCNHLLTFAKF